MRVKVFHFYGGSAIGMMEGTIQKWLDEPLRKGHPRRPRVQSVAQCGESSWVIVTIVYE